MERISELFSNCVDEEQCMLPLLLVPMTLVAHEVAQYVLHISPNLVSSLPASFFFPFKPFDAFNSLPSSSAR